MVWVKRTHCIRGHLFTVKNTYFKVDGRRRCRRCHAMYQQKYQPARIAKREAMRCEVTA